MQKKLLFIAVLLSMIAALTIIHLWKSETSKASGNGDMLSEIDNAALAAQGNDQVAVQHLVNTIFEQNHLNQLDPDLVNLSLE